MHETLAIVGMRIVERARYRAAAGAAGDPLGSYAGPAPRCAGDLVHLLAIDEAERLALGWAALEVGPPGPERAEEGLREPDDGVALEDDDGLRFFSSAHVDRAIDVGARFVRKPRSVG